MRPWLAASPPLPDELTPGGRDFNQAEVVIPTDGDTTRLHRRRFTAVEESREDIGAMICTDWRVRVWEDDYVEFPKGIAGRLVNLDTPELRSKDPVERAKARLAADQLDAWCQLAGPGLRCITYDVDGGFSRLLVDLYVIGADGVRQTATEHMLRSGWEPYVKGR